MEETKVGTEIHLLVMAITRLDELTPDLGKNSDKKLSKEKV